MSVSLDFLDNIIVEKTLRAESLSAIESMIRAERGWKLIGAIVPQGKKYVAKLIPMPAQLKAMVMSKLDVDYTHRTFMGQTALLEPVYHKRMIEYNCDFVFKLEGFKWAVLTGKNAKVYNGKNFVIVNVECGHVAVDDATNLNDGVRGLIERINRMYDKGETLPQLINKSKASFTPALEPYVYALFL